MEVLSSECVFGFYLRMQYCNLFFGVGGGARRKLCTVLGLVKLISFFILFISRFLFFHLTGKFICVSIRMI